MGDPNDLERIVRRAIKETINDPSDDLRTFLESITSAYRNKLGIISRYGYVSYSKGVKSLKKDSNSWCLEEEIFSHISTEEADEHLITGNFQVDFSSAMSQNVIVIRCSHMTKKPTEFGTAYFGGATVAINRINFELHFMGHAIDRITERVFDRLGKSPSSYSQVFSILSGFNPNIAKVTDSDRALVSLYIQSTLNLENAQLWKVAYGSCVLSGRTATVKTVLEPGMKTTPENRILWQLSKQGISQEDLERLKNKPTTFSLWCWLNGQADSLITTDCKPVQPPKLRVSPKEFHEKTKDPETFLKALDSWGIGYVSKYMKGDKE